MASWAAWRKNKILRALISSVKPHFRKTLVQGQTLGGEEDCAVLRCDDTGFTEKATVIIMRVVPKSDVTRSENAQMHYWGISRARNISLKEHIERRLLTQWLILTSFCRPLPSRLHSANSSSIHITRLCISLYHWLEMSVLQLPNGRKKQSYLWHKQQEQNWTTYSSRKQNGIHLLSTIWGNGLLEILFFAFKSTLG